MPILIATAVVTVIGIVCAVMLVAASKIFGVKTDEKVAELRACLPGANCGACGYTGCDGYAAALAADGTVKTNLCIPGADAVAAEIASVLGVDAEDVVEMVATVHCNGTCDKTSDKADYYGIKSCAAAKLTYGGAGKCTFGCIGFGDCMKVCPQDAICLENGIAHVNPMRCIGCGLCAKTCPNHIISLVPDVQCVLITCSNTEKGAVARKACSNACIGCKKCEKTCPNGAITVDNNLACIDYEKCTSCGACAEGCPAGCLVVTDLTGAHKAE